MEQRTEEWFEARRGCVTASRIADLMAMTKSGPSASRANYMAELIVERLTDTSPDRFTSPAMQWGTDTEPQARAMYSLTSGLDVSETGFVPHYRLPRSGASPDGLVGNDGLVEIKCPNTATHIDTLLNGKIADKYIKQMQFQMACTERAWCDFVSFDPRLPSSMQLWMARVPRDDDMIAEIETAVASFLAEVDEKVARLTEIYSEEAA